MVMHGHATNLSATTAMIALHTAAVARGAPAKFLVADLPFLAYGMAGAMRYHLAEAQRYGFPRDPLSRGLCPLATRPGGVLGRSRAGDRLDRASEAGVRSRCRRLRALVRWRHLQHMLERSRPPRDARPRRQPAIIYVAPLAGQKGTLTYRALQVETQVLAAILGKLGVTKGDRVVLYMPMVPEAAIAMLACARIGAVHSVVFGGFAASELAVNDWHLEHRTKPSCREFFVWVTLPKCKKGGSAMKKLLACLVCVLLLAAVTLTPSTASAGVHVYVGGGWGGWGYYPRYHYYGYYPRYRYGYYGYRWGHHHGHWGHHDMDTGVTIMDTGVTIMDTAGHHHGHHGHHHGHHGHHHH